MIIVTASCMGCYKKVVDGENGFITFCPDENKTECMCDECSREKEHFEHDDWTFEPCDCCGEIHKSVECPPKQQ